MAENEGRKCPLYVEKRKREMERFERLWKLELAGSARSRIGVVMSRGKAKPRSLDTVDTSLPRRG
jgi:hypothetical protein